MLFFACPKKSIKRKDTHEMLVPSSGHHCPEMQNRFAPTAFFSRTLTPSLRHFIGIDQTSPYFYNTVSVIPLRNRRSNTAFSEKEFHMVKGDGCLKFPENDTVRTEYDFSGVPFFCYFFWAYKKSKIN